MISEADQDKLRARAVELVRVFLDESNPEHWPDNDTQEDRGARVWLKKSATQTLIIVEQIRTLLAREPASVQPDAEGEATDEQRMIDDAEAMALRILGRHNGTKSPH